MSTPDTTRFDCRPQAIEQWLEDLPRASIGKTAEMLYRALHDIDAQKLKAAERYATLEKLRETVNYVGVNMRKHFVGLAYPLPEKTMRIAAASKVMYELMARGYRQVFYELQKQSFLFVDKKTLVTTVHRSIGYLNQCLLINYEIYSAYHHDYWEQLHELYLYSEVHKLKHQQVADPYLRKARKTSIESEYLRACLLFMAEPYHLRPGDISRIHHHIERWLSLVSVARISEQQELHENDVMLIQMDGGHAPQFTGTSPINSELQNIRRIETEKLVAEVGVELKAAVTRQQSDHGATQDEIGIRLLQRLFDSWGRRKKRRYPRQQIFRKVNVTIGLHNTHRQLMYESYMNDTEKLRQLRSDFKRPEYEAIDIKDVNSENKDVWSTVYNWAESNNEKASSEAENESDDVFEVQNHQVTWTLLNESAQGFSLMTVEKEANKLQVGEIISVQRHGSANREIGIVRWLKAYSSTGVEIGCMLVSPSARPVGLIQDKGDGTDRIVNRGLILPQISAVNRCETLLTFARYYTEDTMLLVNNPGDEDFHIRLGKAVAENDLMAQFQFARDYPEHGYDVHDDEPSSVEISVFNDVWRNI